jgi:trehalose-phosphatase
LAAVTRDLEELAGGGDGAWVERKPFAAVFHTRPMADRAAAAALEARAAELGAAAGAHVLPGKMVVEVAALPAGKAGALRRLRAATGAERLVFAGDDVTDEMALRTIHPPDLGIKVGPGASAAPLRLAGPPELAEFLNWLADRLAAP